VRSEKIRKAAKNTAIFGNECYIFMHQTITLGTTAKKACCSNEPLLQVEL
jgi:hypothetical protein